MYHELVERVNLDYLSSICKVLDCKVEDILEYLPDEENQRQLRERRKAIPKQDTNNG